MVNFQFTWCKRNKYGNEIERTNIISIANPSKDIKVSAKLATEVFKKSFGGLKKNKIISIYPLNADGEPFGEAITWEEVQ